MTELTISLADAQATQQLGKTLGEMLPARSIVLLEGDLGAGKTTLVQGVGLGLGIQELILSPTFTLINEYEEGRIPLYHLDLYRLESSEIESLYLDLYWEAKEITPGIVAIEWANRLPYLPLDYLEIELTFTKNLQRQANIKVVGKIDFDLSQLCDRTD